MRKVEKSTLRTEAIFSEDKEHRYLLRKEWDKRKKKAMVIMINPSSADELHVDHTTMYVINNLSRLEFGSVDIVNIFSKIDTKISTKGNMEELIDEENDTEILNSAEKVDNIIIAWGKVGENNKKIKERQREIFKLIGKYKEKLFIIADSMGRQGYHPLAPRIRHSWELKKLELEQTEKHTQEEEK